MSSQLAVLFAVTIPFVSATTVFAHAYPQSSIPPAQSTIAAAPSDVAITFSEAIEPKFSAIEVTDTRGHRVDQGRSRLVDNDPKRLEVAVPDLTAGTYTVAWHVTSVDTHKTNGEFRFTVADANASNIHLDHVWARPTASTATPGVVYFTATALKQPERLNGVSSPVAASAELHETVNDNGVMKMRPVQSIEVTPGKPVVFAPGGYHVMLMGLKSALKTGQSFPVTLTFEHAAPVTVTAKVEAGGESGMGSGSMDNMPGMHGH